MYVDVALICVTPLLNFRCLLSRIARDTGYVNQEVLMRIIFIGDGSGLELQIVLDWGTFRLALKALLPIIVAILSLLATSDIAKFLTMISR
jgi:hypothetical protein